MEYTTILSCKELMANLQSRNWVIVDCRFDLTQPQWGEEEYRELHIPGAVYASVDLDLSGPKTAQTGRHPLPEPTAFLQTMSRLGIDSETQVVAYDTSSGSFAARLWFLLRLYGHFRTAVLDGDFSEWMKLKLPIESGGHTNQPKIYSGQPDLDQIITTTDIEKRLGNPDWLLIDARSPERFKGQQETIDPVAGHIPGAVNHFYGLDLAQNGLFLPAQTLRSQLEALTRGYPPEKTAVYCGSGVTSTHLLLAAAIAGLPQPRLYVGSWSEWIRNPAHPIVQKETSW